MQVSLKRGSEPDPALSAGGTWALPSARSSADGCSTLTNEGLVPADSTASTSGFREEEFGLVSLCRFIKIGLVTTLQACDFANVHVVRRCDTNQPLCQAPTTFLHSHSPKQGRKGRQF